MLVPPLVVALLVILLLVGGWFTWRYFALRRQVGGLARGIRKDAPSAGLEGGADLEELAAAVRALYERSRAQVAELARERDRLAAILDQMTDGVVIVDAQGRVSMANPAARRLFESPEPLGKSVAEVVRNHQLIELWRQSQQSGRAQTESIEIPARRQFLQMVAIPDRHEAGSLLFIQDLTRLRRLETVRRDFVSNLSHELRTPLASLKALTETLQDGALADPETGPRFLDRIVTEVDAMTQMAQELLDLSRIESGQVRLELASVAPESILASAVERMRLQAERAGLALRVDPAVDLPLIRADAGRLEQVLVNLIHNAIKFTEPGGEVIVSARVIDPSAAAGQNAGTQTEVRFAVTDTGRGIPADDVPRVFERFYRVDKARSGGGSGLGLSIARHIVEAHAGRIWVESIEGRGSTFSFSIPRA